MGIEALIARLEADAESEIEAGRAEAEERADRIVEEARREAEQRRRAWLAEREAELREAAEAELVACRREALARALKARQALLERVFERARAGFAEAARSDAYRAALPSTVEGLLRHLGPAGGRIEAAAELAEAVRAALDGAVEGTGQAGVRVEVSDQAEPGLVAYGPDGRVVVRDTFASRLEHARPALAIEVWARLRGDGAAGAGLEAGADEGDPAW